MNKVAKSVLAGSAILLGACSCSLGGKKVTCTNDDPDTFMKTSITFTVKEGEVTSMKSNLEVDLASMKDDEIYSQIDMVGLLDELVEGVCEDTEGKCDAKKDYKEDKYYKVKVERDGTIYNDDENIKGKSADDIVKYIKEVYEDDGYTCK